MCFNTWSPGGGTLLTDCKTFGGGRLVTGRSLGEGLDFYSPALLSLNYSLLSGPQRTKQAALGFCCQTPEIISLLNDPHRDGLYPEAMSQTTLLS